jgi:sulfofructose kinase
MGIEVPELIGLGEVSLDQHAAVPRLPRRGEKLRASAFAPRVGGQVATALAAAAALGVRCRLVAAVGDDGAAETIAATPALAGVDLALQRVAAARTRGAMVLVEPDGERTIVELRDARCDLDARTLDVAQLSRARALHVDATQPAAALHAVELARAAGLLVSADLDRLDGVPEALLSCCTLVVVARQVADELAASRRVALSSLAERCAAGAVVGLTLGAEGSLFRGADGRWLVTPALKVAELRDTTGCGDVFRGALLASLLRGHPLALALQRATAAAAFAAAGEGALGALPDEAQLGRLLAG